MHKNKSKTETLNLYGSILQMSRNRHLTCLKDLSLIFTLLCYILHILQFCVVCPNKKDSQLVVFLDEDREQVNSCVCPKSLEFGRSTLLSLHSGADI